MAKPVLWQQAVTYGAVGGTQAADLLLFPPAGFRPFERRVRIGHGAARWEHAWQATLTWGIQRTSGMRVLVQDSPSEVTEGTYTPVVFDEYGEPEPPQAVDGNEVVYAAEGMSFVAPGDTAQLIIPLWPFRISAPCRVIYVIDEPARKGFAYGTLPGHPESGEEAFIVEQTADGSVWLTIRAFSRPSGWLWWAGYPILRIAQSVFTRRYLRSLSERLN